MPLRIERRRHPRTRVRWPVTVITPGESVKAVTKDVSVGGAFVRCPNPVELNEVVGLVIYAPESDRPLKMIAEVVWSNILGPDDEAAPHGMGVQFRDIR